LIFNILQQHSATKMGRFSYKNGTVRLQKWDGSATKMGRFGYKNGTVQLQKWDGSATKMGRFGYIFFEFVAE
jgi:hypothetical protein